MSPWPPLGKSVGGTPEAIVANAVRKQASLQEFLKTRGSQLVDLTSAETRIAELQREIEKSQGIIEKAKRPIIISQGACRAPRLSFTIY